MQTALLIVQRVYNPYKILPPILRPKKYDYHAIPTTVYVPFLLNKKQDVGLDSDCAICMNPIDYNNNESFMITPCNHAFHTDCLNKWMDVKLECPTCRTAIPDVRYIQSVLCVVCFVFVHT